VKFGIAESIPHPIEGFNRNKNADDDNAVVRRLLVVNILRFVLYDCFICFDGMLSRGLQVSYINNTQKTTNGIKGINHKSDGNALIGSDRVIRLIIVFFLTIG